MLQDALKQLWKLAYPERELPSLKSELWKDMGWQGSDPSTDFRCVIKSSIWYFKERGCGHEYGKDFIQQLFEATKTLLA